MSNSRAKVVAKSVWPAASDAAGHCDRNAATGRNRYPAVASTLTLRLASPCWVRDTGTAPASVLQPLPDAQRSATTCATRLPRSRLLEAMWLRAFVVGPNDLPFATSRFRPSTNRAFNGTA